MPTPTIFEGINPRGTQTLIPCKDKAAVAWADAGKSVKKNLANGAQNHSIVGDSTNGYRIDNEGTSLIIPIEHNTNYIASKKATESGDRFKACLFMNEPSSAYETTAQMAFDSQSSRSYTFNSGSFNYVVFTYESTNFIPQDTAEAMIREATILDPTYAPYIPDNTELFPRSEQAVLGAKNIFYPWLVTWTQFTYTNGEIKNNATDTRENFMFAIQGRKNGTYVKFLVNGTPITATGKQEFTFTIADSDDINQLYIGHNGASSDLRFVFPFTGKGTYKISFNATGINPTVVNGIVLTDMMISFDGGEYAEPAMTNKELTKKVQGIIDAATNAADFAAFKTAIGNL